MEYELLLKQEIAIEPDLQNFVGFVLDSVNSLGGASFAITVTLLKLMQGLRDVGAAKGVPVSVSLILKECQLSVQWGQQSTLKITTFANAPLPEVVEDLRQRLRRSTVLIDPAILQQRNIMMESHLNDIREHTEREIAVLQQAAEIRQIELTESIRMAETDPLTGLLNRRAFDDRLTRAFHHTMRQKNMPLSLVMFDLDFFKEINDQHGHQFGDAYLNKMAQAMTSVIREGVDYVFRFGGDEFAMVIYAEYAQACEKARQVLELMASKVSIGITAINPNTPDSFRLEDFIRCADDALYEAKNQGRGRIVVDVCHMNNNLACLIPCPKIAKCADV